MPVPIGLRVSVEFLAKSGMGWEDVCQALKVSRELRAEVRRIVLEAGHEHQRESEGKAANRRDAGS